jgi:hypothetical protein
MADHLTNRAQRLIEEFEEGDSVRHGIANVLRHLAFAWDSYSDEGTLHGVRVSLLEDLCEELEAPTLLERALAGDKDASMKVLQKMGVVDQHGQLTDRYAPYASDPASEENLND